VRSARLVGPALHHCVLAWAPHVPVQGRRSNGVQALELNLRTVRHAACSTGQQGSQVGSDTRACRAESLHHE
jgi:hypothetical protein